MSTYTQLYYHIVFSTKHRRPWLTPDLEEHLYPYLGGTIRDEAGSALIVNGVADHLHILARLRQDRALSDIVRSIKANSSGWIHREFPQLADFAWQEGYAAFTVSASQKERVRQYVQDQKTHHLKLSFKEELIAFLIAHEIEFEEKYLWH